MRHSRNTLPRFLRATVIPQRWPACRGDARGLGIDSDVIQNLVDVGAEGDERDDAHGTTTVWADRRTSYRLLFDSFLRDFLTLELRLYYNSQDPRTVRAFAADGAEIGILKAQGARVGGNLLSG